MKSFEYTITDPRGIHLRPAGQLAAMVKKFTSEVILINGEKSGRINGTLSIMKLGTRQGDTVRITFEGEDEAEAAEALEDFFKANL